MPQNNKFVFFDWDNTIISFGPYVVMILKQVAVEMGVILTPPVALPTQSKEMTLKSLFNERYKEAETLFNEKYARQKPEKFEALAGAGELLKKICLAGVPIAIISNKKKEDILLELKQQKVLLGFGPDGERIEEAWDDFIAQMEKQGKFVVISASQVNNPKPYAESGLKALEYFGQLEQISTLHIGDGGLDSDVGFAKNLHAKLSIFGSSCKSVLLNYYSDPYEKNIFQQDKTIHSPEMVAEIKPDYLCHGYGTIGHVVKYFLNPNLPHISPDALAAQRLFNQNRRQHTEKPTEGSLVSSLEI